ncbi:T9SS C-terminal target domain-containing protein [Dokdonia sinensis]|uniref:T9SS C-terminal target domain-containing protein n=1 Tax=Dokdonia sinensis TaxID=2479847 RepID=A0A3M0GKM9_9FLAO|nr:GEVED domain-containing protein [Dokdonia sinensis]RMB63202.1 T9SS C-terminal target domain-containing protein [Dokdonia sinensis]
MKKIMLLLVVCCLGISLVKAQDGPSFVTSPMSFKKSLPLKLLSENTDKSAISKKPQTVPNNFKTTEPVNPNALPLGLDPALQTEGGRINTREPIQNFAGVGSNGGIFPPDPSGAVGPNHYVQMVNRQYLITDKEGNTLVPPTSLNALFTIGNGDPIVLYDRFADRWLLSEFRVDRDAQNRPIINTIKIAISETPDPTGSYFIYEYQFDSFPDYFKIGIWHDGYYFTANKRQGDAVFVINRDMLLIGDPSAQLIGFDVPSIGTSNQSIFAPGPINAMGPELPPASAPGMITYFQDDNFAGIEEDHLKIWEIDVDWNQTGNSTISAPIELPTEPFDTFFAAFGEGDIEQPNTSSRIDAVWGALMYQVQYRQFSDHNSIVLNHTVDVDDTLLGGIRWYELRQNEVGSPWSIFQQGTFSPDDQSRFMGSIAIDGDGAIGLAYSVSGSSVFPSLRYTGRFEGDPLGQMTVAEQTIIDGTRSQNGATRFGDYSQLTIDPTDDLTFWFTGEYFAGGLWRTRVASFKINEEFTNDVGVAELITPQNGNLSATETISVTLRNYGTSDQTGIPVSYSINGGTPITEVFTGTISGGDDATFTFTAPADFSGAGADFDLELSTGLVTDEAPFNDAITPVVRNLFSDDVGVLRIVGPRNDDDLNQENIQVILTNNGSDPQTAFNISYRINGGSVTTQSFPGTLNSEETAPFTFSVAGDFSNEGPYDLEVFTALASDQDSSNDSQTKRIIHQDCIPTSTGTNDNNGCAADGLKNFELGTIKNISGCNNDGPGVGYADFTFISTDLDRSISTYDVTARSGFAPEALSLWIDFNDNGVFEVSEQLLSDETITQANVDQVFALTIPTDAAIGVHTLRVKAIDPDGTGTDINDPCGNVQWGETEDYTVNIVDQTLGLGDFAITADQFRVIPLGNKTYEVVLDLAFELNEELTLDIHNIAGQRIASQKIEYKNGAYATQLNLNTATGVYLAIVGNTQINTSKKFVVR